MLQYYLHLILKTIHKNNIQPHPEFFTFIRKVYKPSSLWHLAIETQKD